MGFMFSLNSMFYVPLCIFLPKICGGIPPKVQVVGSFFLLASSYALMGPSIIFGLPTSWVCLGIGLAISGGSVAPLFVQCLPEVSNRCLRKYKVIEGYDVEVEGLLSDA